VVGGLLGSEPARFVSAKRIHSVWPYASQVEAYVTCEGLVGPFDLPTSISAPGDVQALYYAATILEDDDAPGVYYQLLLRQFILYPGPVTYTRYQVTSWPYPP